MSDLSIFGVIKIINNIDSYNHILEYKSHKGLNDRMPNYSVKIGYGMHVGWAIEGLIGSPFKIDASYLSPAASISNCLEEATKIYGVKILISHALWQFLSPAYKKITRQLDNIVFSG